MKKHLTRTIHASVLALLAVTSASATPLPSQNPFAPQPGNANNTETTTATAPSGGTSEIDGVVLPTTGQAVSNGTPEGLTTAGISIWHQDTLTGDWGGVRDNWLNHGVAISPTWIGEVFGNPSGGTRQGLISDGLINVALDLNLDRMSDSSIFDDTLIHANAMYIYGPGLSQYFVGDFSNTSNIAFYNSVRLQELWISKSFWQKRINVKIGNIAVDTEFFQSSSAALFINGTLRRIHLHGNQRAQLAGLSAGLARRAYPVPAYVELLRHGRRLRSGSRVRPDHQQSERHPLRAPRQQRHAHHVGDRLPREPVAERPRPSGHLPPRFVRPHRQLHHLRLPANFANGTGSLQSAGTNYGIYGVMDQQLFSNGQSAISMFVRAGGAPTNTNFVDYYIDGGFNFSGFIPGRFNDVAGVAVARSHVSGDFSASQEAQDMPGLTAETVIEATYKLQISPWWSIQPDFQYIFTPSGVYGSNDATVLGLRTSVAF